MLTRGNSPIRRALAVCCLSLISCTMFGCGDKSTDAAKPSGGSYYTGPMDKKPAGAVNGGTMKPGAAPGATQ